LLDSWPGLLKVHLDYHGSLIWSYWQRWVEKGSIPFQTNISDAINTIMSTTTDLTKTYSGVLGNLVVVKSRKGNSIITMPPVKPEKILTDRQITARKNFCDAANYARHIMQNEPELLAAYAAKARNGVTPYIMAVTDFLKPPYVDRIDTSAYDGKSGDMIRVEAGDDFAVEHVIVQIFDASGVKIEQGPCELNARISRWEFIAAVAVTNLTGVTITATATDFPGHSATLSVTL